MSDSIDIEWLRPSYSWTPSPSQAAIYFQLLYMDHYEAPKRDGFIGPNNGIVPMVRMYGVTEDGESVLCHVHGFQPYFFVYTHRKPDTSKLLHFRRTLDQRVKRKFQIPSTEEMVLEVDYVPGKSFHGASGDEQHHFLKIVVATPRAIQPVKNVFVEGGLEPMGVYFEGSIHQHGRQIFESNIDFITRFLCDLDIQGTNWIELPINNYQLREKDCISHCQLECDINYTDLIAHPPKGQWANIAPYRILSFDIETTVGFGLPKPEKQQVIQISNIVMKHGYERPFITTIFTLRSCAPIEGAVVKSFNSEADMLMAWSKFFIAIDPDIITGYNIHNFDTRFLIRRAEVLGLTKFPYLGRICSVPSKQLPKGSVPPYNMEGRIQLDLYPFMVCNHRDGPERITLNGVASHFLGKGKDDVHYTEITGLFNGTAEDRRRLAVYCIKDSMLVLELLIELDCVDHHLDMVRDTSVTLNQILTSKNQSSIFITNAKLLRKARELDELVPDIRV